MARSGWDNLAHYLCYSMQGATVIICNSILVVLILRFVALRSKNSYLILAGLALADLIHMSASMNAGQHDTRIPVTECMMMPHLICWSFSNHLAALMLLVVSLDRLLSVSWPLEYIGWPRGYAYSLLGFAFVFPFSTAMISTYLPLFWVDVSNITIPAICYSTTTFNHVQNSFYKFYHWNASQVFASLSVVLYGIVWVVFKRKQAGQVAVLGGTPEHQQELLNQQRRLTVSLGISCLCTIGFFVVGQGIGSMEWLGELIDCVGQCWYGVSLAFYILSNCNPLANIFIYGTRHPEIRQAFKALFVCKQMPDDLRMWKVNQSAMNNQQLEGHKNIQHHHHHHANRVDEKSL